MSDQTKVPTPLPNDREAQARAWAQEQDGMTPTERNAASKGYAAALKNLEEFPHDAYDHCCLAGEATEEDDPEFAATMECKCRKAGYAARDIDEEPTDGD